MTPTLTPEDRARLRDAGEHQWIAMDGCGHCYLCGQTLHVPAHELPESGCLPLTDQLQKVADHAGTFSRSTIALLLASAAKAVRSLAAHPEPPATPATGPMKPAFSTDYQRMWDLVRYQRSELLSAGLIDNYEYAALCSEETIGKPGQGSPSPRRLESYDELRKKLAQAEARAHAPVPPETPSEDQP